MQLEQHRVIVLVHFEKISFKVITRAQALCPTLQSPSPPQIINEKPQLGHIGNPYAPPRKINALKYLGRVEHQNRQANNFDYPTKKVKVEASTFVEFII